MKRYIFGRIFVSLGIVLILTFLVSAGDVRIRSGDTNIDGSLTVTGLFSASNYPPDACGDGFTVKQINADGTVVCETAGEPNYPPNACLAGNSIRQINADGTVVCEVSGGLEGVIKSTITQPSGGGIPVPTKEVLVSSNWANCPTGQYVCGARVRCNSGIPCTMGILEVRCCE